jgi:hypothetical protein
MHGQAVWRAQKYPRQRNLGQPKSATRGAKARVAAAKDCEKP